MKKLLLSAFLAAGALTPMAAQGIYFQYDGQTLENGATLSFTEPDNIKPYGSEQVKITFAPEIYLVVPEDEPFSIQGTCEEYPIQLCIGTDCRQGKDILKEDIENIWVNQPQDLLFECVLTVPKADEYEIPEIA